MSTAAATVSAEQAVASDEFRAMQRRVQGTNINQKTLLATDYLNHFNEIVMILDMVPYCPEIFEEAKECWPRSYQEHFRLSSFSDKDLAIAAYEFAPPRFKEPFESTVDSMNRVVEAVLKQVEAAVAENDAEAASRHIARASTALRTLNDIASGVIHGGEGTMAQQQIDSLLAR